MRKTWETYYIYLHEIGNGAYHFQLYVNSEKVYGAYQLIYKYQILHSWEKNRELDKTNEKQLRLIRDFICSKFANELKNSENEMCTNFYYQYGESENIDINNIVKILELIGIEFRYYKKHDYTLENNLYSFSLAKV